MGCWIRFLKGADRSEFDGKPVGLQRHGGHHLSRHLFIVHLFHSAKSGLKVTANPVRSACTRRPGSTARSRSFGHDRTSCDPFGLLLQAACSVTSLRSSFAIMRNPPLVLAVVEV